MKFVHFFAASLFISSAFAQTKTNITFDVGFCKSRGKL
jgi:hypothetical protein